MASLANQDCGRGQESGKRQEKLEIIVQILHTIFVDAWSHIKKGCYIHVHVHLPQALHRP